MKTLACAVAIVLVAAGCGGDDDAADSASPVIVVDGAPAAAAPADADDSAAADGAVTEAPPATDDTTAPEEPAAEDAAPPGDATDEERLLGFTDCLRGEGLDVADVGTNPDGSPDVQGLAGPGGQLNLSDPDVAAAVDSCSSFLEGASFLPSEQQLTELEDNLIEFAGCLRDQGLDVVDPDLSGGISPDRIPTLFGPNFDPNDPEFADEIAACQSIFAGAGIGQGGN